LGRLTATTAVLALAERIPTIRLEEEATIPSLPVYFSNGPVHLPVRWG
jgi:hypothetical protein